MIQIPDERSDGALKVDVVLPKRIVSVDEQGLAGRELWHELYGIENARRRLLRGRKRVIESVVMLAVGDHDVERPCKPRKLRGS